MTISTEPMLTSYAEKIHRENVELLDEIMPSLIMIALWKLEQPTMSYYERNAIFKMFLLHGGF